MVGLYLKAYRAFLEEALREGYRYMLTTGHSQPHRPAGPQPNSPISPFVANENGQYNKVTALSS